MMYDVHSCWCAVCICAWVHVPIQMYAVCIQNNAQYLSSSTISKAIFPYIVPDFIDFVSAVCEALKLSTCLSTIISDMLRSVIYFLVLLLWRPWSCLSRSQTRVHSQNQLLKYIFELQMAQEVCLCMCGSIIMCIMYDRGLMSWASMSHFFLTYISLSHPV